jgi:uncharacterized circularly permuted ATP-grasp superfamily protein
LITTGEESPNFWAKRHGRAGPRRGLHANSAQTGGSNGGNGNWRAACRAELITAESGCMIISPAQEQALSAGAFDETGGSEERRPHYDIIRRWLETSSPEVLALKRREAELLFRRTGITFSVYSEGGDPERLIPFDIIPRVLSGDEWELLSQGLIQRIRALNAFIHDVYHDREIVRAGHIPERLIFLNEAFRPEMQGFDPPAHSYTHVAGIDIVRVGPREFYVLEDNCRTPSGVSYMLENREAMMRLFPDLFAHHRIAPVSHYPEELHDTLRSVAPANCTGEPVIVVMTPGARNSAYYEHSFLADEMGVELVEGADLFIDETTVYMRTTEGPKKVDVIYRRIDDAYLDPLTFQRDSLLGTAGLFNAYRAGNVTLANAVGAGIADDGPGFHRAQPGGGAIPFRAIAAELTSDTVHFESVVARGVHGICVSLGRLTQRFNILFSIPCRKR